MRKMKGWYCSWTVEVGREMMDLATEILCQFCVIIFNNIFMYVAFILLQVSELKSEENLKEQNLPKD